MTKSRRLGGQTPPPLVIQPRRLLGAEFIQPRRLPGVQAFVLKGFQMNFGVLIYDQVEELDFLCPWEILTMWSEVAEGPSQRLIVAQSPGPVQCAKGLPVVPHVSFADCQPLE